MTTIDELLNKLIAQTAQLRALTTTKEEPPMSITTKSDVVLQGTPEYDAIVAASLPEHDWDSYDSSDIHLRQQEWDAQAQPVVIQHFIPKKRVMITDTQRAHANTALELVMPGMQLGRTLSQNKAYEVLTSTLGEAEADRIMASA